MKCLEEKFHEVHSSNLGHSPMGERPNERHSPIGERPNERQARELTPLAKEDPQAANTAQPFGGHGHQVLRK